MDPIEQDIAGNAKLLADSSRVAILLALSGARALPAGELARAARIGPASASAHLARLMRAGVVEVIPQGRHRYYRIASSRLPELLEALATFGSPASQRAHGATSRVPPELQLARWCYGHLGGRLAVTVAQAMLARGLLTSLDGSCGLTPAGARWFEDAGVLGLNPAAAVRVCPVDWSERLPHLAGPAGRALARRMVDARHLVPVRASRGLRLTDRGRAWLRGQLGIEADPATTPGRSQPNDCGRRERGARPA